MHLALCVLPKLHELSRDLDTCAAENVSQRASVALVMQSEKGVGGALCTCTACSPNAMHVVLNGEGERVVEHILHVRHIKPTRRNICGNHQWHRPALKVVQNTASLALKKATTEVYTGGVETRERV